MSEFSKKIKTSSIIEMPAISNINESYGLRIFNEKGEFIDTKTIQLDDPKELQLYVSTINATSKNDSIGILVSLDGVFQQFLVDEDEVNKFYIYNTELPTMSSKNIPITIKNEDLVKQHRLDIIMLYYFDKLPNGAMKYIDFYVNSISFYINSSLDNINKKFSSDTTSLTKIPERFVGKVRDKGIRNVIDTLDLDKTNLSQPNAINAIPGEAKKLNIFGFGGKGKYATTIFLNNHPISFANSEKTLIYELDGSNIYNKNFEVNVPNENGKYPFYSITIPLDNSPFVFASQKFALEVQNPKSNTN